MINSLEKRKKVRKSLIVRETKYVNCTTSQDTKQVYTARVTKNEM